MAGPCHSYRQCDLPALSRAPQCRFRPAVTARACLRSATLSPLGRPRGRLRSGAGRQQCRPRANCVGPSTPPVCDSLTPRRAAGPGAHSVGQGLTVTAAPTPDPRTLTHARRACLAVSGQAARAGRLRRAPRQPGLEQSFSKPPDPLPARAAVPNHRGFCHFLAHASKTSSSMHSVVL